MEIVLQIIGVFLTILGVGWCIVWFNSKILGVRAVSKFELKQAKEQSMRDHRENLKSINSYSNDQIEEAKASLKKKFFANTSDNLLQELQKNFGAGTIKRQNGLSADEISKEKLSSDYLEYLKKNEQSVKEKEVDSPIDELIKLLKENKPHKIEPLPDFDFLDDRKKDNEFVENESISASQDLKVPRFVDMPIFLNATNNLFDAIRFFPDYVIMKNAVEISNLATIKEWFNENYETRIPYRISNSQELFFLHGTVKFSPVFPDKNTLSLNIEFNNKLTIKIYKKMC